MNKPFCGGIKRSRCFINNHKPRTLNHSCANHKPLSLSPGKLQTISTNLCIKAFGESCAKINLKKAHDSPEFLICDLNTFLFWKSIKQIISNGSVHHLRLLWNISYTLKPRGKLNIP